MSIIISGGGSSDFAALYKIITASSSALTPSTSSYIQIWDPADSKLPRPYTVTVMAWGLAGWMNKYNATDVADYPPSCGTAFGIVTIRGDIPQKLYTVRGYHQQTSSYVYDQRDRCSFIGPNPTLDDEGWYLANPGGQSYFYQSDLKATDVAGNKNALGKPWDFVANGGNGHYFSGWAPPAGENFWKSDSPGSNGSVFGNGFTSTGTGAGPDWPFPSSCGGSGSPSGRGPLAKGATDPSVRRALKPMAAMLPYALEVAPAGGFYTTGGTGEFTFDTPADTFFVMSGAPFNPRTSLNIPGGMAPPPRDVKPPGESRYVLLVEYHA